MSFSLYAPENFLLPIGLAKVGFTFTPLTIVFLKKSFGGVLFPKLGVPPAPEVPKKDNELVSAFASASVV